MERIRKVTYGDEKALAYVQTESWKAAFKGLIPDEVLVRSTDLNKATAMYQRLLDMGKGNGYILEIDGKPHCIAWWDAARDEDMQGAAELICIHSLKENWGRGYGHLMMERILEDVQQAGYSQIMLWVFEKNTRAIGFYKAHGFVATGRKQPAFGAVEERYIKYLNSEGER